MKFVSVFHDSYKDSISGWPLFASIRDFDRPPIPCAILKFIDSTIEGIGGCFESRVARRSYNVIAGFLINHYDVTQELSVIMAEVEDKYIRSMNDNSPFLSNYLDIVRKSD